MLTVRLDQELEKKIMRISRQKKCSKSDIIKDSLSLYFAHQSISPTPYELGHDFFGKHGSSTEHRANRLKDNLKKKIYENNFG